MKNFTKQNFKTNPLWIRLLIMAFMLLLGSSSAWAWSYKLASSGWNCKGNTGWSDVALYTTPTGNSKQNLSVAMLTNPGDGFNILRADNCNEWNDSDHNHCLYVGLSGTAATNTSTIVRATAYWNNGLYSKYTVVVPGGKVYIKPTGGNEVEMTKNSYTYTASVSLSSAKTFDLYGASVTTSSIQNQWDMPAGGKPSSVRLSYTGLNSPYQYVKITYDLKTNQITFEEEDAPCDPPAEPSLTNPVPQCGGSITLPESANEVNLKWYDAQTGGNVVSNTEITATGTYWAAAVTECESTSRTAYTVTINPIPEVNSLLSTLNICIGSINETDLTTLSHVEVANGSAVWYDAQTGGNVVTEVDLENGGTYWVAAENSTTGCKSTTRTSFTININNLPKAPSLGKDEYETCAHASNTVNLDELAATNNVVWYIGETEVDDPGQISLATAGTFIYTAKAMNQEGCQSATGAEFELTVKPLPAITDISVNNSTPVINEDVLLTVEGGDIETVEWSITSGNNASLSDASGNSVKLTSTKSGAVTVTATATSGAGCTTTSTKEVTFSETEDCTPEEVIVKTTNIEIWCRENGGNAGSNLKCYAWDNNKTEIFGSWAGSNSPNRTETRKFNGNTYTYKVWVFDASKYTAPYKVIFSNNSGNQTGDLATGEKNYKYFFWYNASESDKSKNSGKDGDAESLSYKDKEDKPITAPAVKTVSATSEEGSGIVAFTGKVLKTGCANGDAIWVGYQYKKANEEWPTTGVTEGSGVKQLVSISNNPGSEDFTAEVNVENLDDGDYHFRAYIINGYNFTNGNYDQGVYYGLDKLVTVRNTKTAIISVALQHADKYGNPILSTPTYCAGTTAYLLLTYEGSRPDVVNWSSTLSNTITKVDGDLYQFTVAGSETITVSAKNEENIDFIQGTIEVAAYSIPLTPMVELDKSEICSNDEDGATITVTNAQDGIQYYLYETGDDEAVQGPITGIGSLAFTKIKTAATYYVSAVNSNCLTYKVESQKRAITVIDASQNTIAIEPTTKTINPWGTVTLNVTKNSQYDYTLKCMQEDTDVTANLVINKKGDTYSIKFPKPSTANIVDGQVTFSDIIYIVTVTLDGSVQCGTTSATSEITLTQLVEDCD